MLRHPYPLCASTTLLLAFASPVMAQYPAGATVQQLPQAGDPGDQLAVALRTLAVNPRDLGALIAAGRNALVLGDPSAAVGFFGRADQIAPRDGRVKAGLGSALVQLDRPADALRQFAQANALGAADADLASDRGLANDLSGDPAAAQRDYDIALAAHPDDETTRRRLALSQGIAGDRTAAIATLDPLIRKRDIAAWRAQTFVLAMTGDASGANAITRIMLPQQQAMLQPFLIRLATLTPAEKARAVHFGEMPAGRGGTPVRTASAAPAAAMPVPAPAPAVRQTTAPAATPAASALAAPPPRPAPVEATSVQQESRTAASARSDIAAAAPRPAPVRPAQATATAMPVAPPGYRYVRRARSAQEIFSLRMPYYDYALVRIPDAAVPARASQASTAVAPAPVRVALAAPADRQPDQAMAAGPPTSSPAASPVVTTGAPPPGLAPMPAVPPSDLAVPPAVSVANGSGAPAVPAMPIGSNAMGGHYDLPHAALPRVTARSPNAARTIGAAASVPTPRVSMNATGVAASSVAGVVQPVTARRKTVPTIDREDADTRAPVGGSRTGSTSSRRTPAVKIEDAKREPAPSSRTSAGADDANPERGTHGSARSGKHRSDVGDEDRLAATEEGDRPSTAHGRDRSSAVSRRGSSRDQASVTPDGETETSPRTRTGKGKTGTEAGKGAKSLAISDKADRDASPRARTKGDGSRSGKKATDAVSGSSSTDDGSEAKTRSRAKDKDASTSKKPAARPDEDAKDTKPSSNSEKVYVQVAGGANREDLGKAWDGVRKKAPELMRGKSPSTTSLKATNRLLVGPFKDEDEAQAFVNKMAGKGVSGFVYKNAKGKKVEKVDTGG